MMKALPCKGREEVEWHFTLRSLQQDKSALPCPKCNVFYYTEEDHSSCSLRCPKCDCLVNQCAQDGIGLLGTLFLTFKEFLSWLMITLSTTPCAGCNTLVNRSQGCNHMNCSRCKTHFCYSCGQSMSSGLHNEKLCGLMQAAYALMVVGTAVNLLLGVLSVEWWDWILSGLVIGIWLLLRGSILLPYFATLAILLNGHNAIALAFQLTWSVVLSWMTSDYAWWMSVADTLLCMWAGACLLRALKNRVFR